MDKSPINALQEFFIKEGYVPTYTFVAANNGSHNQFLCKVTCKDLSTTGLGKNKKEAKHNAAQTMLSLLTENNNISMSPSLKQRNRTNGAQNFTMPDMYGTCSNIQDNINTCTILKTQINPALNYVGLLQELCTLYKLNMLPSYKLVNESGPSHMKVFTIESSMGTFQETGKAHCKKSAKQEAAKNLLQHLRSLNILPEGRIEKDEAYKWIFKDDADKLDIEIFDVEERTTIHVASQLANQSEKAQPFYIEPDTNNIHIQELPVKNSHTDLISVEPIKKIENYKCTLDDDLLKLNVEILDNKTNEPFIPVTKLSKEKGLDYVESITDNIDILNLSIEKWPNDLTSAEPLKKNESCKSTLEDEDNLRELNTETTSTDINEAMLAVAALSGKVQSICIESIADNVHMQNLSANSRGRSIALTEKKKNESCKLAFEEDLSKKFNIEISDFMFKESALPIAKLTKQPESICFASTSKNTEVQFNNTVKDYHSLFKKRYANKISNNLRETMQNICALNNYRSFKADQVRQDIQTALGVKLKQIKFTNCETGFIIICLRMLSTPIITQFGIGKTLWEAENRAMYEIINTIVDLLN